MNKFSDAEVELIAYDTAKIIRERNKIELKKVEEEAHKEIIDNCGSAINTINTFLHMPGLGVFIDVKKTNQEYDAIYYLIMCRQMDKKHNNKISNLYKSIYEIKRELLNKAIKLNMSAGKIDVDKFIKKLTEQ